MRWVGIKKGCTGYSGRMTGFGIRMFELDHWTYERKDYGGSGQVLLDLEG